MDPPRPARHHERMTPSTTRHILDTVDSIAARQHGVVARQQLLEAGIARARADRLLQRGYLKAVHQGVYRIGPVAAPLSNEQAAILACGPDAALSHRSAAILWGLLPARTRPEQPEVTLPRRGRKRPGIRIHAAAIPRSEIARLHGLPVTRVPRTLVDLAGSVSVRLLSDALGEAIARRLTTAGRIRAVLDRHARRRGIATLRELVEAPPGFTRSIAEKRFLRLVKSGGLPAPEVNASAAGVEVDFLWRAERLIVEIDGAAFHSSPPAFERDRRRGQILTAAGLRVVRITWRQITEEAPAVLVRLTRALYVQASLGVRVR